MGVHTPNTLRRPGGKQPGLPTSRIPARVPSGLHRPPPKPMNLLFLAALIVAGLDTIRSRSLLSAALGLIAAGLIWNIHLA